MDGADRDVGAEVPAIEIDVLLVVVDIGGFAAAATVLLSRSVGVAGRSFSSSAGAGRSTRRCAAARNHVVGDSWTAEKPIIGSNLDFRGNMTK